MAKREPWLNGPLNPAALNTTWSMASGRVPGQSLPCASITGALARCTACISGPLGRRGWSLPGMGVEAPGVAVAADLAVLVGGTKRVAEALGVAVPGPAVLAGGARGVLVATLVPAPPVGAMPTRVSWTAVSTAFTVA